MIKLRVIVIAVMLSFVFFGIAHADLTDGLVAYYPFNGNANDESGNENHGTVNGATLISGRCNFDNSAYNFDGVDDYISTEKIKIVGGSPTMTASIWFKANEFDFDDATLISQYNSDNLSGDGYRIFSLKVQNNYDGIPGKRIAFGVFANDYRYNRLYMMTPPLDLQIDKWYYIVAIYDSGSLSIYLDGEKIEALEDRNSRGGGVFFIADRPERVGMGLDLQYHDWRFNGGLDEARIYNRALSENEIFELYNECLDSDGDGVPDDLDICLGGDDTIDSDLDSVPDDCDPCPNDAQNDADGDGVCGDLDTCPGGDDSINSDGDALPDFCDVCPFDTENDADGDGVCESEDNCPATANPNQADYDFDDLGDVCDSDDDNDSILDSDDNCPLTRNVSQSDIDQDGAGDACDSDDDNDGVLDADDLCLYTALGEVVDDSGCSISEICPCENEWKNHGAYVKCVAHASEDFLNEGLITESMKDLIVSNSAQSDCGHKK
jgi:hypothetical protein